MKIDLLLIFLGMIFLTNLATYEIAEYNAYSAVYHDEVDCVESIKKGEPNQIICKPKKDKNTKAEKRGCNRATSE